MFGRKARPSGMSQEDKDILTKGVKKDIEEEGRVIESAISEAQKSGKRFLLLRPTTGTYSMRMNCDAYIERVISVAEKHGVQSVQVLPEGYKTGVILTLE